MTRERTVDEELSDNALLLALYSDVQRLEGNSFGDRIKATKIAFLAAYPLYTKRIKAVNCRFFRYKYGPFSKHLVETWEHMRDAGFMVGDATYSTTPDGDALAADFKREVLGLSENAQILDALNSVSSEFAKYSTHDIMEHCYGMDVRYVKGVIDRKLRDIDRNTDLTDIIDDDEAKSRLYIPQSWQTTLALAFNRDAQRRIDLSLAEARSGHLLTLDEWCLHAP